MSSSEFKTIFENAAAITRIRCRDLAGVETVIEAIRVRIESRRSEDPRLDRELFFEPWLDAQQLGVPEETAEEVSRQLWECKVLRLWTRLVCPQTPDNEDGIILETDSESEVKVSRDEVCPQCGALHRANELRIDSAYAPNFPGNLALAEFNAREMLPIPEPIGGGMSRLQTEIRRLESIARVKVGGGRSVLDVAVLALDRNTAAQNIPSPIEMWISEWFGPLVIVVLYMLLIIPLHWCAGPWMCILASVVVFGVVFLVITGQVKTRLAPSAVQRGVTRYGFCLSLVLVGAGTAGIEFTANEKSKLKVPIGGGEHIALPIKFEYGTVNGWLVGGGILCFVLTLIFVLIYDQKLGWFTRSSV